MDVGGVGTTNPYSTAQVSQFKKTRKDFQGLGEALASGDVSSAQSALAVFLKDVQSSSSSSNGPFAANSQASKDYQTLQSAIQSGDMQGAQSAYSSLMQDLQSVHPHRHHHHHPGSGPAQTSSTTIPSPSTTQPTSAASSIDTLV